MKNRWMAACSVLAAMALPVMAQDETASDPVSDPVSDTASETVAEQTPQDGGSENPAAEAATPAEAALDGTTTDEPAPTAEETATDDSATESGDGGGGWNLYAGLEYDLTTIDFEEGKLREDFGGRRFDSDFYKLRLGARLFEGVGVELQAGLPANDSGEDELETKQFYALYLVPTGVALDLFEVSARVGYAFTSVENDTGDEDFDGVSFGLAAELPIRVFGEGLPNLRFGVGGTVYQAEREARVFGFHGGVRYDFSI